MKSRIFALICLASALLLSGCQVSERQRAEIEKEVRAQLEEELRAELEEEIREDILDELKKEGVIPEDYGEDDDDGDGGFGLDLGMGSYVRVSRVTSACSTAASVKNHLVNCMTEFDTKGFGPIGGELSYIGIEIRDGVWNATVGNLGAFKSSDSCIWANDPNGARAGDSISGVTNPEVMMEIRFANDYPDIDDGYVGAVVNGGRVEFLYFSEDTTYPIEEMERLIDDGGYDSVTYDWEKYNGVSAEGYIVGTSPRLTMAE